MRIFIITQDEPIYAPVYLNFLIQRVNHEIIGITALSPAGKSGWYSFLKQRLGMYGLLDFFRAGLLYEYHRVMDLIPIKINKKRFYSIRKLAKRYSIPLFQTTDLSSKDYIESLKSQNIDILLSVAANQIFKDELLKTPKIACLNTHSSLLPKYRGLDALYWALVHNETEAGVTVHLMNTQIDDGDIVGQKAFEISPKDSLHQLYFKSMDHGSKLIAQVLDQFELGTVNLQKNQHIEGMSFSWPNAEATKKFRNNRRRFF